MGIVFLSHLQGLAGIFLGEVIPFLLVLTVVVFIHELGHFLTARWCGVRVLVFSIGFGPEIIGFNDRHGTRWKVATIPLGGFVKFFGDDSAASTPDLAKIATMDANERSQSFVGQSLAKRAAIVVAGPMANFILAITIFAGMFMLYGKQNISPRAETVQPNSAAARAGIQPGDLVVSIDDEAIGDFTDMQRVVSESAGQELRIKVRRGDTELQLTAVPTLIEEKDIFGTNHKIGLLGISRSTLPADVTYQSVSPPVAVWLGVQQTWSIVDQTFSYIGGVIVGHKSADQLSGPIGIARIVGKAATISWSFVVSITAAISVSIGLLNLFPIPLLDGGHLLFYGLEAVRGRPLSERAQEVGFRIGLAIVLMLMIFATFNDIVHLATS